MRRLLILPLSLILVSCVTPGTPARALLSLGPGLVTPEQFQQRLSQTRLPNERRPGVSAAAVRLGQPTVFASAGMREMEERRPAGPDTEYLWYSVTKLFTATAVMQLVEQGKVDLDAPLARYVPDFKPGLKDGVQPTVAQFLSHSSGVPQVSPLEKFGSIHLAGEPRPSDRDLLRQWTKAGDPLSFRPGTRYEYTNTGYLWLGSLVETVSGESYEGYVTAHILRPLGMDHTGFQVSDWGQAARGYARTHSFMGILGALLGDERYDAGKIFGYRAIRHFEVDGPSYAGLIGSVRDMARFAAMMLADGALDGRRILQADTCRRMREPRLRADGKPLGAGLGWMLKDEDGDRVAYHEGWGGGFRAELCLYPARGYAVVLASNDSEYDGGRVCRWIVSAPKN
jgi:CubicO group peptidase (beta-lactamase class C family)